MQKTSMSQARNGEVASVNGKIYVIGGHTGSGLDLFPAIIVTGAPVGYNQEYDPLTDTWSLTYKQSMPSPREGFGIAVYDNKIYCIGGIFGGKPTGVNEVYDPATDTWETKTSMPTARSHLQANVINGKIYLIGGYPNSTLNEVYDPITDSWTTKAPLPTGVMNFASAVVDNKLYAIAGRTVFKTSEKYNSITNSNITQVYNPEADSWSLGTPFPSNASNLSAGATTGIFAPKRIYVFGSNTPEIYNPNDDTWTAGTVGTMTSNRTDLGVAVIRDVLYAIGGIVNNTPTGANEQYIPLGYQVAPPSVAIVSPENATYATSNVSVSFVVDDFVSQTSYSLDNQSFVVVAGNFTLTGLADGFHCMTVHAEDILGSIGTSETVYFTVDENPLRLSVLSPERNRSYNTTEVSLNFTVNEPVVWIRCNIDDQKNLSLDGNTTIVNLPYGFHNLSIQGQDILGNTMASKTIAFNIVDETVQTTETSTVIIAVIAISAIVVGIAGLLYFVKKRKSGTKS